MSATPTAAPVITISQLDDAREIYRHKDMAQALYDEGEIMNGVLVNLHGDEHRSRRRLENRLFRRETLEHYERDRFPAIIAATLDPHVAAGGAELVTLSHQLMMNLAAFNAGVDRPTGTAEETHRLYGQMMKFIEGATIAHTTRDKAVVNAEVAEAMGEFRAEFLDPSIDRRRTLLADVAAGRAGEDQLPRDVLTILLRNVDNLSLPPDIILREIAFFLLAGAHTSATAFTRALDNIFRWIADHPADEDRLRSDRLFVQRCVHETVRLNPSSPVGQRWARADVERKDGSVIPAGTKVVLDLMSINRDPAIFGDDAATFNPYRAIARDDVGPFGLSFGHGMHHCIGQELAAGVLLGAGDDADDHLFGLATTAVQAMIDRGARPDPQNPPVIDTATSRPYWSSYPVVFRR